MCPLNFNSCTVHLLLFYNMNNKCTSNSQIITHLPSFLLSIWYMVSIIVSNCALLAVYIYCHVTFQYFAHPKWILYNSSFSLCFLQYKNLISQFILCLVAAILVFLFCLLFPLILMLKYFGASCLVLHILLNQVVAFVFSNFTLVFFQLLQIFACWASVILIITLE